MASVNAPPAAVQDYLDGKARVLVRAEAARKHAASWPRCRSTSSVFQLHLFPVANRHGPVLVGLQRALCQVRSGDIAGGIDEAYSALDLVGSLEAPCDGRWCRPPSGEWFLWVIYHLHFGYCVYGQNGSNSAGLPFRL